MINVLTGEFFRADPMALAVFNRRMGRIDTIRGSEARTSLERKAGLQMAVLMTAHIPGATKEMSEGLRPLLEPIRQMILSSTRMARCQVAGA